MSHSPQQLPDRSAREAYCIGAQALYNRGPLAAKTLDVFLAHLRYPRVVTSHLVYGPSKHFHLPPPFFILLKVARTHQKDVDVTVQTTVTPRCRTENRRVKGKRVPGSETFAQTFEELPAEICQLRHGLGRQMPTIQGVETSPARLRSQNQPMLDQTIEHALRRIL